MEPEPVENWREKRADPDAWTFKKAQRARHFRARRDLSWESKRFIGPEKNFVSSSAGTREPQRGRPLQGTGPKGLLKAVSSRKSRGVRVLLCNPGRVASSIPGCLMDPEEQCKLFTQQ